MKSDFSINDDSAIAKQLKLEFQSTDRNAYLSNIEKTAKSVLASLPEKRDGAKVTGALQNFVERLRLLLELGAQASNWSDAQLTKYLRELAWLRTSSEMVGIALLDNSGGGGGNDTCITKCRKEYDKCINDEGCDTSGWVCICCSACSLQYAGCIARCVDPRKGTFGGGEIAI
jgi:hypothetical protein